jgi:YndJ-like protein
VKRRAIVGGGVWCGVLVAALTNAFDLTWIELLFLFAPLVIVPLGIHLTDRLEAGASAFAIERLARLLQFPAALLAVLSFSRAPGFLAACLALPWLIICLLFSIGGIWRIFRGALARLDLLFPAVSFLYLAVGGMWLAASRLGLNPMGFQEPIVLLTAIHFHYAGFATPLLARSAGRALGQSEGAGRVPLWFRLVAAGVLIGPCLLAMGFVLGPRVKLAAALILASSEVGLAMAFVLALNRVERFSAQLLLTAASASVAFSMALAAVWAIGEYPLQPFVNLDQMERLHGTANALGFTLCGMLGWILASLRTTNNEVSVP